MAKRGITMKQQLLVPHYLTEFQCTGGACEDTCCAGFHIPVGQQSYEEYQTVKGEFGERLREHVTINPKSSSHVSYAVINATKGCPFLTEERLCSVHAELGEGMLSSACSKYPRSMNMINKQLERAATLSCPEVARLVLLDKDGLDFTYMEGIIDDRDLANIILDTNMLPMTRYLYELREYSISIIQDRRYSLTRRLFVLGTFYYKMKELVENGEENKIPFLIEEIQPENCAGFVEPLIKEQALLDSLAYFRKVHPFVRRYETVYKQLLEGSGRDTSIGSEFLKEYEHLLENYLVNYVFKHLFPFSYGENVFQAYLMLQLHYDVICLHIRKVANYLGDMNEEEAVRIIQSWVKEAEHNSIYMPTLFKHIQL